MSSSGFSPSVRRSLVFIAPVMAGVILSACSGNSDSSNATGVGGSDNTGGRSSASTGGSSSRASSSDTGGSSAATGGTSASRTTATGGQSTTTKSTTGGQGATGGASSTSKSTGGRSSTGGSPAGTGGAPSGGRSGTGGAANTGGTLASGGSKSTGGAAASGGAVATGGSAGDGGAPTTGGTSSASSSSAKGACVATAVVAEMKLGWNVGNSLDSIDASKSDTAVETAWGNPAITAELMQAAKKAGFGAVRIPVTWINRFGSAPNYTISANYINRVEQVVKYVLDQGLYAIINIHHDGGNNATGRWLTLVDGSKQVTTEHTQAVLTQFNALWKQIATHFKDYDNHLIFESMNEVMVDYAKPDQSWLTVINQLNQAFVDTVRPTGGNNDNRCLVVPGYNTNIDYTVSGFVAPKDSSSGKLILSDHYYDPYTFSGSAETHAWGTGNSGIDNWAQEDYVQQQMSRLKSTFISKGLPMILGEYGAVRQSGYEKYQRYYVEYVTKAAHDVGIAPFIWDNGSSASGSEAFGFIDRKTYAVMYPTLMEAMTRAVTSSYKLSDVAKP